jgi:hypothetical protein
LERQKGGRNSLGERSPRSKINPNARMGDVEEEGSPLGMIKRLNEVKTQERGPHSSHKIIKKEKTSIPLGGRNF